MKTHRPLEKKKLAPQLAQAAAAARAAPTLVIFTKVNALKYLLNKAKPLYVFVENLYF